MTGAPARRMGFNDRGLLFEGMRADITVFDPLTVKDNATYTKPHQYASGIQYLLVNGEPAISKGEYTGALTGEVLRKPCS